MSSPILVIGALGNVGAELVKQLLASGEKVRASDMNEHKVIERFDPSVEAVRFDFSKPETYELLQASKKCFSCVRLEFQM